MLGGMSLARSERAALADLFLTLGPDQPTLCEGWDTKDLLIHLLVRERSPLGAIGNRVSLFRSVTDHASADYAKRPWAELVDDYRSGPPAWNPSGWGKLGELDGVEMFIHHEDARRGQEGWQPRAFDADTTAQLDKIASSGILRLALRKSPVGVIAQLPGHEPVTLKSGDAAVTISGESGEIILWIEGRDASRVELTGDTTALAALSNLKRGI